MRLYKLTGLLLSLFLLGGCAAEGETAEQKEEQPPAAPVQQPAQVQNPAAPERPTLDRDALKRILTEPKNALMKQYEKMFDLDGIKLVVEPEVLDLIVDTSIEKKLGARGLRSICEQIMTDAMYEAPSSSEKTFNLTLEYAKEKLAK